MPHSQNSRRPRLAIRLVFVAAALSFGTAAIAQDYPSKPIKLVIPYTPGGSIDTIGRLVANQLEKQLGQPIIIENRPGASGLIGSNEVQRAQADGYTLLFNASSQVYMPLVVAKKTYDAQKDFTPVAQIGYVPLLVAVSSSMPVKSLSELAALAKANPKKYTWATSGLGTTSHLTEEIINRELGLDMEIIAYKGAVPQLTDVVGGHVTAAASPMPGINSFVKAGKLKAIAVTSKERLPELPDVPTVAESGMPGFELLSWYGIWGPANLPAPIRARLNAEVSKAVDVPAVKDRFVHHFFVATQFTTAEFEKIIDDDIAKIGKAVKTANIKIEF